MKRLIGLVAAGTLVAFFVVSTARAQALLSEELSATATVGETISLSIVSSGGDPTILALGTINERYHLGENYIIVKATANYAAWNLAIYTNNFDVTPDTVAWQTDEFGGLVNKVSSSTVRLAWAAVPTSTTAAGTVPEPADPGNDAMTNYDHWRWVADTGDMGFVYDSYLNLGFGSFSEWFNVVGAPAGLYTLESPFEFHVYLCTYENNAPGEYSGNFVVDMFLE